MEKPATVVLINSAVASGRLNNGDCQRAISRRGLQEQPENGMEQRLKMSFPLISAWFSVISKTTRTSHEMF